MHLMISDDLSTVFNGAVMCMKAYYIPEFPLFTDSLDLLCEDEVWIDVYRYRRFLLSLLTAADVTGMIAHMHQNVVAYELSVDLHRQYVALARQDALRPIGEELLSIDRRVVHRIYNNPAPSWR